MARDLTVRPTPNEDEERASPILAPDQRRVLWAAVCEAAESSEASSEDGPKGSTAPFRASDSISNVNGWQLAEALALLCLLLNTARVDAQSDTLIEAIRAVTIGKRQDTPSVISTSEARPCNQSAGRPKYRGNIQSGKRCIGGNIQRVVEVSNIVQQTAQLVRPPGICKAFDLTVCGYCLLTYFLDPFQNIALRR